MIAEDENESGESEFLEDTVTCDCKGKCARSKGKGLCSCRRAGKSCSELCKCKSTICNNKTGEAAERRHEFRVVKSDHEEQFHLDVQASVEEIQTFVAGLSDDSKNKLLVNLLAMGRGSLDFARNLVGSEENPPPTNVEVPEWCKCRHCREMDTEIECVCCKRVRCVTLQHSFSNICLDRENLEVTIKERSDFRADEFDFSMESFRKAGYRRYILWKYGKLGRETEECFHRVLCGLYELPTLQQMASTWVTETVNNLGNKLLTIE